MKISPSLLLLSATTAGESSATKIYFLKNCDLLALNYTLNQREIVRSFELGDPKLSVQV